MFCLTLTALMLSQPTLAQASSTDVTIQQLQNLREIADTSPASVEKLERIEAEIPEDASYALRRELALAQMSVRQDSLSSDETLKLIEALRVLAKENGDDNTVSLMDIRRIYMNHVDDDIGKFIDQLNVVSTQIGSDASPEVMEALELSYGNMYFDAGHFDTALRHQLAALDWADKLPFGRDRARLFRLGTIADLYNAMELPEQALEYLQQALAQPAAGIPSRNRTSLLATRAVALMKLKRLPEAETVFAQIEELARTDTSVFTKLRLGTLHAELLLAASQPQRALEIIEPIATLAEQNESTYYLARSWLLRGQAQMQLDQVDAGIALMDQAVDFFQTKGQMIDVLEGLDREIEMLREKKQWAHALQLMDRRQTLWSQLFRNERGRAVAEVEARHTAQTLEHQIALLSNENRIQEQSLRAERLGKILALVLALFAISISVFLFRAIMSARRERDRLSEAVRLDALTGASSRYQFQRQHAQLATSAHVDRPKLELLLLDLDHFKAINDQYGHEAGDAVLKAVVDRIRRVISKGDEIYRWGGEEFLLVFKDRDDAAMQRDVLRLVAEVENTPVPWHGQSLPIRLSGGWVPYPLESAWKAPLVDAIRWADAALYHAKNSGRRRIVKVELTDSGRLKLVDRRPVDLPQLLDWQHRGLVNLHTLQTNSHEPQHLS